MTHPKLWITAGGFLTVLVLPLPGNGHGPDSRVWSSGTARTLPQGRKEIGLFQPLRFAPESRLEWSVHPIWFLQIPNVRIKIGHAGLRGWQIASRHTLTYPTPLLRRLQKKGLGVKALADIDFGGIITDDPDVGDIPHMILTRHEIMATGQAGSTGSATAKAGIALSVRSGRLDNRTTIDLPIVYPRLGVLYHGFGLNVGLDVIRTLIPPLEILVDGDLLYLPGAEDGTAFEHKGLLIWTKSRRFQLMVGYKFVFGQYPFGSQMHLLPLFDVQWGWGP